MSALADPVFAAHQTATAYLVVKDAAHAIEFYKKAFGATESFRLVQPDGEIGHAEIVIGGSTIMLADEYPDYGALSPQSLGGSPVRINLRVEDVDAFAQRAVTAGAKFVRPIQDQFYGERSCQLSDPFGYVWIIATITEAVEPAEMQRRFDEMMKVSAADTSKEKVNPIREGFRTLTTYLVAKDADALIDFVKQTFDAEETFRSVGSAGGRHAELRIEDSMLMIGGGGPGLAWQGEPVLGAFHVYVRDCDAIYQRALKAGAISLDEPADQPYGERSASVIDAVGNHWYIATRKGDNYKWEGAPTVQPYMHPRRAEPVIDFLTSAFGAKELKRHATPDGVIHHATVKIGDSYLEMGEAHGPYHPMRSMFYLYMADVDALYHRALAAGATSMNEPADQPYGDRVAAVMDAFGNQWYIATHVKDLPH